METLNSDFHVGKNDKTSLEKEILFLHSKLELLEIKVSSISKIKEASEFGKIRLFEENSNCSLKTKKNDVSVAILKQFESLKVEVDCLRNKLEKSSTQNIDKQQKQTIMSALSETFFSWSHRTNVNC